MLGSTRTRWRSPPGGASAFPRSGSSGSARTTSGRRPETGPCGQCSEIFYDRGERYACGDPACGPGHCDRYMEIYNLVFMEYDLQPGNSSFGCRTRVDTGMGVERTACVLQAVDSVFDTDGFQLIMNWVAEQSGVAYGDSDSRAGAPRPRRPRPRRHLPDRGGHRAVQRGARLHLPASPAACDLPGEADRARGGAPAPRHRDRADGRAYPMLREHAADIERDRARRGGEVLRDARARDEGFRRSGGPGGDHRRRRVRAGATYGFPIELAQESARNAASRSTWTDSTR